MEVNREEWTEKIMNGLSNDIHASIKAIKGLIAIAELNADDPAKVRQCLNKITISCDQLESLTNEVDERCFKIKKSPNEIVLRPNFDDLAAEEDQDPMAIFSDSDFHGYRVMLVEDNEQSAEFASDILEMFGLTIELAVNGKEAVDKFQASEPGYYDLIFMDISMPVMNGLEATKAIRALGTEYAADIPIVAMSANTFAADIQECLDCGLNEYVAKPVEIKHLKNTLERWLKRDE